MGTPRLGEAGAGRAAGLGFANSDFDDALWIGCAQPNGLRFDLKVPELRPNRAYDVRFRAGRKVVATTGLSGDASMDGEVFVAFVLLGVRPIEGGATPAPFAIAVRERGGAGDWSGVEAPPLEGAAGKLVANCP